LSIAQLHEISDVIRIYLLHQLDPDKVRAIGIVVQLTLQQPTNSLAESCRQLLATPYDARLHPHLQDMLRYCERREGAQ
jgi:hypothetical protein